MVEAEVYENGHKSVNEILKTFHDKIEKLNDLTQKVFESYKPAEVDNERFNTVINGFFRIYGMTGGIDAMIDFCNNCIDKEFDLTEPFPEKEEDR